MTLVAREQRPLPGVRFQVAAPPLTDVLPRMDIAVFVGFAASGPLHVPVAVEDVSHFDAIFGTDAPLAWDQASGATLYAYLAPSVRAFFKNGGLRAWIIRVADPTTATANVFPMPGLVEVRPGVENPFAAGEMVPAVAVARSPGSWSDPLLVGTALFARPFRLVSYDVPTAEAPTKVPLIDAQIVSPGDVVAGDMLRLTFRTTATAPGTAGRLITMGATPPNPRSRLFLMLVVQGVSPTGSTTQFTGDGALWFQTSIPAGVSAASQGTTTVGGVAASVTGLTPGATDTVYTVVLVPSAPSALPAPGTMLPIVYSVAGTPTLWLTVSTATRSQGGVVITGDGLWRSSPPSAALLDDPSPLLERLTFRLTVADADGTAFQLDDLGFASTHPRAFWALPSDAELYEGNLSPFPLHPHEQARRASLEDTSLLHAALVGDASDPRFPLAARSSEGAIYYPVGMALAGGPTPGCGADSATALTRDGLSLPPGTTLSSLFLDPLLAGALTTDLLSAANAIRYAGPAPRALHGIHAALDIDEATLIAVPDAGHAGWYKNVSAPLPSPGKAPPQPTPPAGEFATCVAPLPAPQALTLAAPPDANGTYTLVWDAVTPPPSQAVSEITYVVNESATPDFASSATVATVSTTSWTAYARAPNDFFYWVAAESAKAATTATTTSSPVVGAWSAGLAVRVDAARYWIARSQPRSPATDLLDVQRALLRTCYVRGDLFAVLALPDGYREDDAVVHAAALRTAAYQVAPGVPPLGSGESVALAFGALYHPWLMGRDEGAIADVRRSPPDGAMTAVMARRAIDRGAWISPANVLLSGVVALSVPVPRSALSLLQDAQVNAVRQEARGFVCLADDTLSLDADLLSINVRRLLSLLRRAALQLGATYVFEPNDARLTRLVQRGFGGLLATLFQRGAFAGATATQSYQLAVVTDTSSEADTITGSFIVDIMVAPSLPLRFLTVRLVQTGDSGTVTEPS
jgi:hypothetical protein